MVQVNHSAGSSHVSSPPHTPSRSRSNSILKNLMDSPKLQHIQQQQQQQTLPHTLKRSTTGDSILSRIPSIHHHHHEDSPLLSYSPSQLSDAQLLNKPEHYELKEPIGYGSSAVVYGAIYKPTNRKVAVKVIDLDMFERNQIDELRRETSLMALSKHPNVLRVYGSFVSGSKLYIVTPYLSAGSCLDIMKTTYPDGLDEISIATILKQALEGLIYLHKSNHIHRDVKAGNLLMDEHGLVQVGDFGVSSSLTENNEVRKTFVGTPCWMAPEVMEQAGYDYKADIWSFGITSIELATGHAPYAKYAAMKVLMMTLSRNPPTLPCETTKHKFSKTMKEMIDLCLQKDPAQRPPAEKLLQHPFFRQAKKKDFLVKSILVHVPPLNKRPHKKVPQKHITFESTDQWDFGAFSDDDDNDDDCDCDYDKTLKKSPTSGTPNNNDVNNCSNNSKKHITFGSVVINSLPQYGNNRLSPKESPHPPTSPSVNMLSPEIALPSAQKMSRFVVDDNTPDQLDSTSSQTQFSGSSLNDYQSSPQLSTNLFTPSLEKVGVGLGISGTTVNTTTNASPSSTIMPGTCQQVKKGRFSVNQTPQRSSSILTPLLESNPSALNTPSTLESATSAVIAASTMKIASSPLSSSASSTATPRSSSTASAPDTQQQDLKLSSVSRVGSNDSLRKSRFATHHSPGLATCDKVTGEMTSYRSKTSSLSVANDNCTTAASANGDKVSRFSVAKYDNKGDSGVGQELFSSSGGGDGNLSKDQNVTSHDTSHLGRKKGRFQLSGLCDIKDCGGGSLESPQSSISSSYSSTSSLSRGQSARMMFDPSLVYANMEHLYKQTEAQKVLLYDILAGLSLIPGATQTITTASAPTSVPAPFGLAHKPNENIRSRSDGLNSEISYAMDHLHHLLMISFREREQLQRENETLKRELERWRRQTATSSSSKASVCSGITAITTHPVCSTVADPLPPSPDTFDYFTPTRPHTTSPITMTPFEIERLRSSRSTIHPDSSTPFHTHLTRNNSDSICDNQPTTASPRNPATTNDMPPPSKATAIIEKSPPTTSSVLPTPSSSYTWVSKSSMANLVDVLSSNSPSP